MGRVPYKALRRFRVAPKNLVKEKGNRPRSELAAENADKKTKQSLGKGKTS